MGKLIAQEIFITFVTDSEIVGKTLRADAGTVADNSERVFRIIFVAMFAEAIMLVKTVFTDVNNVAVRIENFPRFRSIIFAFLAEAVGTNREIFEVESVIVANGNFGVEIPVSPVRIAAEARAAPDMDVVFVAAVFFRYGVPSLIIQFNLINLPKG